MPHLALHQRPRPLFSTLKMGTWTCPKCKSRSHTNATFPRGGLVYAHATLTTFTASSENITHIAPWLPLEDIRHHPRPCYNSVKIKEPNFPSRKHFWLASADSKINKHQRKHLHNSIQCLFFLLFWCRLVLSLENVRSNTELLRNSAWIMGISSYFLPTFKRGTNM